MKIDKRGIYYQPDGHLITCRQCDCEFRIDIKEAVRVEFVEHRGDRPMRPRISGKCPMCTCVSQAWMRMFKPEVPTPTYDHQLDAINYSITQMLKTQSAVITRSLGKPIYSYDPAVQKEIEDGTPHYLVGDDPAFWKSWEERVNDRYHEANAKEREREEKYASEARNREKAQRAERYKDIKRRAEYDEL